MSRSANSPRASSFSTPDSEPARASQKQSDPRFAASPERACGSSQAQSSACSHPASSGSRLAPAHETPVGGEDAEQDEEEVGEVGEEDEDTSGSDESQEVVSGEGDQVGDEDDELDSDEGDHEQGDPRAKAEAINRWYPDSDAEDAQTILSDDTLLSDRWFRAIIIDTDPRLSRPSMRPVLEYIDKSLMLGETLDQNQRYLTDNHHLRLVINALRAGFERDQERDRARADESEREAVLGTLTQAKPDGQLSLRPLDAQGTGRAHVGKRPARKQTKPLSPARFCSSDIEAEDSKARDDLGRRVSFRESNCRDSDSLPPKSKVDPKPGSRATTAQKRATSSLAAFDENDGDDEDEEEDDDSPTQKKKQKLVDSDDEQEEADGEAKTPRLKHKGAPTARRGGGMLGRVFKPHQTPNLAHKSAAKSKPTKTAPAPLKLRPHAPNAKVSASSRERSTSTVSSLGTRNQDAEHDGLRRSGRERKLCGTVPHYGPRGMFDWKKMGF